MKSLLPLIPSYIKNSSDLIRELKMLHLPRSAKLFTADASSMYINIDSTSGIQAIPRKHPRHLPQRIFLDNPGDSHE